MKSKSFLTGRLVKPRSVNAVEILNVDLSNQYLKKCSDTKSLIENFSLESFRNKLNYLVLEEMYVQKYRCRQNQLRIKKFGWLILPEFTTVNNFNSSFRNPRIEKNKKIIMRSVKFDNIKMPTYESKLRLKSLFIERGLIF